MARYPDLRYKFIRGLIKYEHRQRRHQFLKSAAEWTSKAIVSLSLIDYPIRSANQAMQLEGVGPVIASELKKILQDNAIKEEPPSPGKFPSTGSALLVALLKGTKEARQSGCSDLPLVEEDKLKEFCQQLSEEKFNPKSYTSDGSSVLCPAWWRINVLISRGFVKKRTRGKCPVYELLPAGEKLALRIRGDSCLVPKTRPPSADHQGITREIQGQSQYLNQNLHENAADNALYGNDDGSSGVILLVDRHELGGDRVRLGELSRRLSEWQVRHRTSSLPCGDYVWKWQHNGKETTLPILMERKRADDLAESIRDGRYFSQKEKMIQWKKEFGMMSGHVSLQYVVESEPAAYRVACTDGCNGVGKCGNPTVEQVEAAIGDLQDSNDFQLLRTQNLEGTVELLASITAELSQRVEKGEFNELKSILATHIKPRGKTPKRRRGISTEYCNSSYASVFNDDGTKHRNFGTLTGDSRGSRPRKRSHFKEFNSDDLTVSSPPQVSPLKKRRGFLETRRPLSCCYSDGDDDPSHRTPVCLPNTSQSVFRKSEEQRGNSKHCQTISGNSLSFINTEWSDSEEDLPPTGVTTENYWPCTRLPSERSPQIESWSHVSTLEQSENAKITMMKDVLPDSSLDDIITALSSTGGNVEMALEKINRTDTKSSPLFGGRDPSTHLQRWGNAIYTNESSTSSLQSDEVRIAEIQRALPSSSFENVVAALVSSGGNVEKAIESISGSLHVSRKSADMTSCVLSNTLSDVSKRSYDLPRTVVEISDDSRQSVMSAATGPNSNESSKLKEEINPLVNQTLFSPFDDAKIALIREVLPYASLENVVTSLNATGGNVEQAIIETMRLSEAEAEESNDEKSRVIPIPTCEKHSDGSKIASGRDFMPGITFRNTAIDKTGANINKNDVESDVSKISTTKRNLVITTNSDSYEPGVQCGEDFKITAVRDVLPDVSTKRIVHALRVTEGNVEEAIIRLLNSPKQFGNRKYSSTVSKSVTSEEVIDLT